MNGYDDRVAGEKKQVQFQEVHHVQKQVERVSKQLVETPTERERTIEGESEPRGGEASQRDFKHPHQLHRTVLTER